VFVPTRDMYVAKALFYSSGLSNDTLWFWYAAPSFNSTHTEMGILVTDEYKYRTKGGR
jgi:hypothetical protein